jgi:uncharacterized membrane protein YqjE
MFARIVTVLVLAGVTAFLFLMSMGFTRYTVVANDERLREHAYYLANYWLVACAISGAACIWSLAKVIHGGNDGADEC